jgi:hypothetical protein
MSKKTIAAVLIGCGGLLLLLIVLGLFTAYRLLVAPGLAGPTKMPSGLKEASVVTGADFLTKDVFYTNASLGTITDIALGQLDPAPGVEIGVAGTRGAAFLDKQGNLKSAVSFASSADRITMVEVDGDHSCEFMNRGAWGVDASLMDHRGRTLWTYGGLSGVDDMCAGDVDGDGRREFVVGFNGGDGVHLLDDRGHKKWNRPDGNVWHVETADTNGDGRPEIVHSNAGGEMTVRDSQGNVLSRAKPAAYFSDFSLCRWPTKSSRQYALSAEDDTIWLYDFRGKTAARFDAPQAGTLGNAFGVSAKLKPKDPEYLAVLVEFENWNRSIIYVYDGRGTLVYQEILPEACAAVAAIPSAEPGTETILIGGNGHILQYKLTASD